MLIGPVPPCLLHTDGNPEGVPRQVFEDIKAQIRRDRPACHTEFLKNFYTADVFLGSRVSEEAIRMSWNVAVQASARATLACVDTWSADFREDVRRIDVPTLVIHGPADRILPFEATAKRLRA